MTNQEINTNNLRKMAEASEDKEAYQLAAKTERCRVGIGARLPAPTQTPTFFVEIVVNMCPACNKVDLVFFERALKALKNLEQNGYTLTCQDDKSVLCEKLVSENTVHLELEEVKVVIEKQLEKTN